MFFSYTFGERQILCKKNLVNRVDEKVHYPNEKMRRVKPGQIQIPQRSFFKMKVRQEKGFGNEADVLKSATNEKPKCESNRF